MVKLSRPSLLAMALLLLPALYVIIMHFADVPPKFLGVFLAAAVGAAGVAQWGYGRSRWLDLAFDGAFALAVALLIFRLYPGEFFDDAGFVMRYLENAGKGYFYSYNTTDGPVFGISSPLQGLVTGAICATGIWLPEQTIRRTAFAGLVLLVFFMIRILRNTSGKGNNDFIMFGIIVLLSSKMFLNVMKAGLETPMHIAVVMAAFWSFYTSRTRLMWFLLALAVISKLDAVPLVLVTGLFWLAGNYKSLLPVSYKNKQLQNIVLFAVVPVAIWIAVATHFFGSPLPQSAYAKIHYHFHPDDYWFPFFVRYAKDAFFLPLLLLMAGATLLMTGIIVKRKTWSELRLLLPGAAFMATMVLYYFYNPGERMMWYYALPDVLMLLQLVISVAFIIRLIDHHWIRTGTSLITGVGLFMFIFPDVLGGKYWLDDYLGAVEYERNQIGVYLGKKVAADDTLMTWHGLTGRYVKGYVMDMSGLNSKLVTEYKRDIPVLTEKFRPNWAVNTRYDDYTQVFQKPPYSLDTVFYDVTAYGYPEWLVYKRVPPGALHEFPILLGPSNVWSGEFGTETNVNRVKGDNIQLAFKDEAAPLTGITFGVEKADTSFNCRMELHIGDSLLETKVVRITRRGRDFPGEPLKVIGVRWNFKTPVSPKTETVVVIKHDGEPHRIVVVDPSCIHRY